MEQPRLREREQEGNTRPFDDPVDIDLGNELLDGTVWERPDNLVYRRDFSTNSDLELELLYVDSTESANAAFNITQDLQEIGINVLQTKGTAEQVVEQFEAGDFDLLLQFRVFNNDPIATDLVFGTDGCPAGVPGCSGVGVNYGAFSNAAIDQLLTAADATTDLDARLDVYADIDRALASEFAAIPLYVRPAFTAYDTSIVGIEMAPNIGPLTSLADWGILDS